ncbi:MAG: YcxB family protein [Clostridia bacterium]|nr:YcxB family protein [Clostridia bacterium]
MQVEFDVKMTTRKMYDYMLYHMFTSFQGILGESIGVLLIGAFILSGKWIYLITGVIVLFYLPVALYMNAKKQVLLNPAFKEVLHYTLDDNGITITVGDSSESQKWEDMRKAVSTNRSIIVYTSKVGASIFPKEDMGSQCLNVIEMISTHMNPKKVNIRN